MFSANDMIDLVGEAGVLFVDEAIFATASGTARNSGAK
jgi:hypothetical protein